MNKTHKLIAAGLASVLVGGVLYAQNPISPMGVYIADPSARVAPDGRLYIYGSRDESTKYYCSNRYDVLSTTDARNWRLDKESRCGKSVHALWASFETSDRTASDEDIFYLDAILFSRKRCRRIQD